MKVTFKVTGGPAFVRQFKVLDFAAGHRIETAVARATAAIERGAKSRVPRESGELAGTIRSKIASSKMRGTVMAGRGELPRKGQGKGAALGKGAYAPVVEFGSHSPVRQPKPFMFPSAEAERPHFMAAVDAALKGAVAAAEKA